jgi:hypothetical protein
MLLNISIFVVIMGENIKNKQKLLDISKDIRDVISKKQQELQLSFIEDTHTYYIKSKDGAIVDNFPSVSTVIKQFYEEFPDLEKSLDMCNGDIIEQDKLLQQWRGTADYANSKGSRTHYLLETDLLKLYGSYKNVRQPIFECDEEQVSDSNAMIDAGHKFIQLMHRRGAILLDTEMVLGSSELGYTGQPDKVWIMFNDNGELGMIITDWKTNKQKNFEVHAYTKPMLSPFEEYMDTALTHYMIQLPLYGRLLLDMFKGTKYENIKFFGCIIVHLLDTGKFVEYRVEKSFIEKVLTMDPLVRIDEIFEKKKEHAKQEFERVKLVKESLQIKR